MKFIHTADIHLDSPLVGLSAYQSAPVEQLRSATRGAFHNLVSEAIEEQIDFMVIAGDLYDGNWRDFNTGIFFCTQMGRLKAAEIPVYLLFGNHDAESEMTKKLELPSNVHRFSAAKATTFQLPKLRVALHGRSFREAATTENLAIGYPDPLEGWLNIGVLHTALEGGTEHANYAPCSVAELEAKGYQYWALGHVHEHRVMRGKSTVAFPGNLQGRHIRETGPRGALIVTAEGNEILSVDRLFTDVLRWHSLHVEVSTAETLADVVRLIARRLEEILAAEDSNLPIAARVILSGTSPAHGELFGLESQLRAEVLAQAAAIDSERLWVEKVVVATKPPATIANLAARSDALAELQALLAQAADDQELLRSLHEDLMPLVERAPLELVRATPELDAIRAANPDGLQELIRTVALDLVAHLARME